MSRLIARAVKPAWFASRGIAWVTGAGALAALAVYSARPDDALDHVGQLGVLLLAAHVTFAWIILHNWRKPNTVRVISAKALIDAYVTDAVERRIDSLMLKGRYLCALLVLLAAAAATPLS